ncbi:hypothetical protein NX059_006244 [Plenodomus lindquistii]|nr:hypothetical protein NX059_006244 [Plenodomus lindquistii]
MRNGRHDVRQGWQGFTMASWGNGRNEYQWILINFVPSWCCNGNGGYTHDPFSRAKSRLHVDGKAERYEWTTTSLERTSLHCDQHHQASTSAATTGPNASRRARQAIFPEHDSQVNAPAPHRLLVPLHYFRPTSFDITADCVLTD